MSVNEAAQRCPPGLSVGGGASAGWIHAGISTIKIVDFPWCDLGDGALRMMGCTTPGKWNLNLELPGSCS